MHTHDSVISLYFQWQCSLTILHGLTHSSVMYILKLHSSSVLCAFVACTEFLIFMQTQSEHLYFLGMSSRLNVFPFSEVSQVFSIYLLLIRLVRQWEVALCIFHLLLSMETSAKHWALHHINIFLHLTISNNCTQPCFFLLI